MSNNKQISRRKVLASAAILGAGSAVGGAGTYAALSDSGTAELVLEGGSIVLKISPAEAAFGPPDSYSANEGEPVEHEATWTISNTGTLNASSLFLTGIEYTVSNSGQATREQILRGAKITTFEYADGSVEGAPEHLWALGKRLDPASMELSSADEGPELPAFADETRELTIGIEFDYSNIDGNGGFSVTAKPAFSIEQ
jgi:predicted ribosomally synthesized peptide with SipW-like signal peptide